MPYSQLPTVIDGEAIETEWGNQTKDNFEDIVFNRGVVKARALDNTGGTIQTSENIKVTATLAIPAHWAGYDIEAIVSGRVTETGTLTAPRTITNRIRHTSSAGATLGFQAVPIGVDTPDNSFGFGFAGYLEGQSTTGNIAIVYTAQIANDTNQVSWDDIILIATAWRTS